MVESGKAPERIDSGFVWIASVLLLGILILGWGYFAGHRVAFYGGLLVTLAGVFTGIQRLLFHQKRTQTGRT